MVACSSSGTTCMRALRPRQSQFFVNSRRVHSSDARSGRSQEKQIRQLAARNKETNMTHSFIPRTLRKNWEGKGHTPVNAEERAAHAAIIIEKLEQLKREQESEDLLHKRLKEVSRNDFVSWVPVSVC